MQNLRTQKGMTAIGWLFTLALIGFFALITLRLAPVYLDYYEVAESLASLQHVPELTQKSPEGIRELLQNRLDMNDIDTPTAKDAVITNSDGILNVGLDYKVLRPFIGNVSFVVHFKKDVKVIAH